MTTNLNPWATPDKGPDDRAGRENVSTPPAHVPAPDHGAVWEDYRQSVTQLAHAQATALQETDTATQEAEVAVARAQADVDQARVHRARVEERVGPFEAEIAQILADAGVSPDGAGSGSAELPVETTQQALTAMDGLTEQLHQAHRELAQARRRRAASTARWISIGVVLAAVAITAGVLGLLGAAGYVQAAGAVIAFCVAWPARTRGWTAAAISGGIAAGVLVAVVALTGPVISAILLLLGAVVAVILAARAGMIRAARVKPPTGPSGLGPA
ncbi:hypothetical protein APR04_006006 [Promicromonospora umidemergens]|uniref:Uncharacterized protein n=3 Tax=Promicromonospora TaxID=43676 RepID=A0ABW4V8K4_9MICO|nr:hypothetical protein [Promicromonospora umidemergens]MCP2287059.1 hypothetical protein [Promicromonospora umidemergens]